MLLQRSETEGQVGSITQCKLFFRRGLHDADLAEEITAKFGLTGTDERDAQIEARIV